MIEPSKTATHENGKVDPALAKALVGLIAEMPSASKDAKNPHFGSDYASLASIWETARPILAKHGFALVQLSVPSVEGICLETRLIHESGAFLSSRLLIPVAQKGNPQVYGSTLTYARRYGASPMIGLVTEEDDDGNAGAAAPQRQPFAPAPAPRATTKPLPDAAAAPPPAGSQLWFGTIEKVTRKSGTTNGREWTVFNVHGQGGERFSTFDVKWAEAANFLVGVTAKIAWLRGKKGKDLFSIEAADGPDASAVPPDAPDDPFDDELPPF